MDTVHYQVDTVTIVFTRKYQNFKLIFRINNKYQSNNIRQDLFFKKNDRKVGFLSHAFWKVP